MNKDVFVITNENWDAVYAEYQRLEAENKELRAALREWAEAQRAWEAEQRAHTITDDDAEPMTKAEADVIRSELNLLKAYDAALAAK